MPITLDDIRAERERRLSNPAAATFEQAEVPAGVTLQDIQAERARRGQAGADPFAPIGGTGDPTREFRTDPAQEAVQEALPFSLLSQDTLGATAGEIVGGGLGTLAGPAAPIAVPVGAAIGSGVGLVASRFLQGEPVTASEVTGEMVMSVLPEAATQIGKKVLRAAKASRRARFEDLANQARKESGQVFQPPEKEMVSQLFDQVAESGVKVDASPIQRFVGDLGPRYDDLLKEIRRIDNSAKTGGQFQDLANRLQGGQRGAYDIGKLQDLHSEIGKRINNLPTTTPFDAKALLIDFNNSIDDAIFNGLAKGQHASKSQATRDTLRVARAGYAKIRRTERLRTIVEKSVTSDGSGAGLSINLGRIKDTIRKGIGKEGKAIQRTFEHDPGSRQRFYSFMDRMSKQHDKINVSLADFPVHTIGDAIGQLGDMMAAIYSSTAGQEAFEKLVISGRGKLTHSTIANASNIALREAGFGRDDGTTQTLIPDTSQ